MKNEGVPFISALTLLVSARVSVLNPFLPKPLLRAQMELEAEVGIEPWPKICRSNLKLHCNFESTTFETTALTLYKLKLFLDISMAYEVFAPHNDQFPTLLPSFPLYCAVSDFIVQFPTLLCFYTCRPSAHSRHHFLELAHFLHHLLHLGELVEHGVQFRH